MGCEGGVEGTCGWGGCDVASDGEFFELDRRSLEDRGQEGRAIEKALEGNLLEGWTGSKPGNKAEEDIIVAGFKGGGAFEVIKGKITQGGAVFEEVE